MADVVKRPPLDTPTILEDNLKRQRINYGSKLEMNAVIYNSNTNNNAVNGSVYGHPFNESSYEELTNDGIAKESPIKESILIKPYVQYIGQHSRNAKVCQVGYKLKMKIRAFRFAFILLNSWHHLVQNILIFF